MTTSDYLGKEPTETEIAWAAGLYEGEGTICRDVSGAVRISIQMTDKEPVEKMQKIFGGHLYGPTNPRNPKHSPQWKWQFTDWCNVIRVALILRSWLSPRRQTQIDKVLEQAPPRKSWTGPINRLPPGCPTTVVASNAYAARHRNHGEKPCEICRECERLYNKNLRERKTAA